MSLLRRSFLLALILLGSIFVARGMSLWMVSDSGNVIQNWISPASEIPGKQYMWTWGVSGSSNGFPREPDLWHFHVIFSANDTAEVLLLWNLNQSILYSRTSSTINEIVDANLPRTNENWRWDWLIKNPNTSGLRVDNFTVTHYAILYPERQNGLAAIGSGLAMIISGCFALAYYGRRDTEQK